MDGVRNETKLLPNKTNAADANSCMGLISCVRDEIHTDYIFRVSLHCD
jgi:hypothetical protein